MDERKRRPPYLEDDRVYVRAPGDEPYKEATIVRAPLVFDGHVFYVVIYDDGRERPVLAREIIGEVGRTDPALLEPEPEPCSAEPEGREALEAGYDAAVSALDVWADGFLSQRTKDQLHAAARDLRNNKEIILAALVSPPKLDQP